jgi:hypothetical protein
MAFALPLFHRPNPAKQGAETFFILKNRSGEQSRES